ncbi:GNAT family N-acetyltransferase [Herbaspirillum camelliae]|uniref:GNAT family N-acetyltransferase n=1 Tax=Herbaspirillum camelliae TaxID=1892903 RepID=UPI000949DC4B|nr:GNAT family N-acetyltransferase [Herbaspirillum camelliae]
MKIPVTIRRIDVEEAATHVNALSDVLIDCVEGGASVSFVNPLSRATAISFWQGIAASVGRGERSLLIAEDSHGQIVGTVQLITSQPENQPHRADVAKMLVLRRARRQGIASRLMQVLEEVARQEGKSVLVLDTVSGGAAERMYQQSGWKIVGSIPNYALMPDGELCGTTYYHKQLQSSVAVT